MSSVRAAFKYRHREDRNAWWRNAEDRNIDYLNDPIHTTSSSSFDKEGLKENVGLYLWNYATKTELLGQERCVRVYMGPTNASRLV